VMGQSLVLTCRGTVIRCSKPAENLALAHYVNLAPLGTPGRGRSERD
jgi:hypothetical protein